MNIQVLSDIHVEFHWDGGASFAAAMDPTGVDVLVVAGDVGHAPNIGPFLKVLCEKYPHVVFVPGNHEYYTVAPHVVDEKLALLQRRCSNFHPLVEDTVTIEGQRFVGTTLWFPDSPDVSRYKGGLNDFHLIMGGFESWVIRANARAQQFLRDTVDPGDVVVTHHSPHPEGCLPKWRTTPLNMFYNTDMRELIQDVQPPLWVYGHTHDSLSFKQGHTRLVCNPFGYARKEENPKFNWKLVVEV